MKIWYVVMMLFLADMSAQTQFRAMRPDVASSSQLVACSDAALIALLSQLVCTLNVDLSDCCSFLTSQIDAIETDIQDRLGSVIDTFGNLTAADQIIQNIILVLSIIDNINDSVIVSLVDVIESSGSAFDQIVSQIDADIEIDQTIQSGIDAIDTQLDLVESLLDQLVDQDCQSVHEIMISDIDVIASGMDNALLFAQQIVQAKETIASQVDALDTQFDVVASVADILAADACASSSDIIASSLTALQQQEASCCAQLSSQLDAIQIDADTRLDAIQTILNIVGNFSLDGSRVSAVVSVIEFIENNGLELFVESSFEHISSQIELLQGCGTMPLSAPGTISVPGNYCLTQDIASNIIIAASNVSLNLNGFTITGGIAINTGLQNITVTNGYVTSATAQGVLIGSGTNDIAISDLIIDSCPVGVFVNGSASGLAQNVSLSRLRTTNCSTYGYEIVNCQGICSDCEAFDNTTGFFIAYQGLPINSANIPFIIRNGQSTANAIYGFVMSDDGGANVRRVIIAQDCKSLSNGSHGFVFQSCQLGIYRCISSNNSGNGFYFTVLDSTGLVDASSAIANTLAGFVFDTSIIFPANMKFTGNYSTDNKLLGTNTALPVNYGYSNTNVYGQNSSPFWWLYWNSTWSTKWSSTNGSNPT